MPAEELSDYRELLRLVTEPVDWRGATEGSRRWRASRQAGDTRLLLRGGDGIIVYASLGLVVRHWDDRDDRQMEFRNAAPDSGAGVPQLAASSADDAHSRSERGGARLLTYT